MHVRQFADDAMRASSLRSGPECPTEQINNDSAPRYWILLVLVFFGSLAIRWTLLGERWINPDEGAHLMDAALVLQGFIPDVDFGTRQPLYVYALAGLLKSLGTTLTAGRVLPLICSLLTGLVIYGLGTELVDRRVGLVASVVWLSLPLEILQSVVVKTEAPVSLLVVSSIYAAVAGQRRRRASLFVVSGILASLGYYVRETALLVPFVVMVFLLLSEERHWRGALKPVGLFFAGYVAVVMLVVALFAPHTSPEHFLDFTPIAFLANNLGALGETSGPDLTSQAIVSWEGYGEPVELYRAYLEDAIRLHSFLLVAMVLVAFTLLLRIPIVAAPRELLRRDRVALALGYVWLGALALMYGVRYLDRGFFIDYFREFLPALVLLLALWLCRTVPALQQDRNVVRFLAVALPVGAAGFLIQMRFPDHVGLGHHATLATAILATGMVAFSTWRGRARWYFVALFVAIATWIVASRSFWPSFFSGVVPSVTAMAVIFAIIAVWYRLGQENAARQIVQFATLSVVASTFALSLSYSAIRLDSTYEAVWPPDEAKHIADIISRSSSPNAEVLSGAVIWEFLAGRRPFALISHPMGLQKSLPPRERARIKSRLSENPPEIVVMDSYTEAGYARNVPYLDSLVQQRYERIATSDAGFKPVSVFRLIESGTEDTAGGVE